MPELHYDYDTIELQGYKSQIVLNRGVWENYSFCYGPNPFPITNETVIYILEIITNCDSDIIKSAEGVYDYGSE